MVDFNIYHVILTGLGQEINLHLPLQYNSECMALVSRRCCDPCHTARSRAQSVEQVSAILEMLRGCRATPPITRAHIKGVMQQHAS